MNNNIKIELELPTFEKELNISVTLRKDGEVISTSSSEWRDSESYSGDSWKQTPEENMPPKVIKEVPEEHTKKKRGGGNMMDISI